jgi:hypothetical protein
MKNIVSKIQWVIADQTLPKKIMLNLNKMTWRQRQKKMNNLSDLWNNIKWLDIGIIGGQKEIRNSKEK